MLTKDRHSTRTYMQLLAEYRRDPAAVAALLPHRAPDQVQDVVRRAAVVTWTEVLGLFADLAPDSPEQAVLDEIRHRVE